MSTSLHPEEVTPVNTPEILKSTGEITVQHGSLETGATKPRAGGMKQLFKNRNFSLLFGGQTISVLGNALYMVALPWLILRTGGNAQELGIVLSAYGIPLALCTLAGGWVSDRLRPRRVMLIADAVRMVLVGLLAALALSGHPAFWEFCAIAVPLGVLGGVFTPASMAMVPDTLSQDDLQAGNGLMMATAQGGNLVGSSVAGVVVSTFTSGAALAIDAATFLVSAASLALMRGTKRPVPGTSQAEARQEYPVTTTEAVGVQVSFWEFLRTSRLIQICLLLFVVSSLATGGLFEVALPTLINGPMHGSASNFGFIMAGWGAGSFVGSIIAGLFGKSKRKGLMIFLGGLLMAGMLALIPAVGPWGAIACMLIGGLCSSGFAVLLFTEIQLRIPGHLMGRVMGLLMFSAQGLYPISTALAGVLATHFGPVILFPLGGLILALTMLIAMTQKVVRAL